MSTKKFSNQLVNAWFFTFSITKNFQSWGRARAHRGRCSMSRRTLIELGEAPIPNRMSCVFPVIQPLPVHRLQTFGDLGRQEWRCGTTRSRECWWQWKGRFASGAGGQTRPPRLSEGTWRVPENWKLPICKGRCIHFFNGQAAILSQIFYWFANHRPVRIVLTFNRDHNSFSEPRVNKNVECLI